MFDHASFLTVAGALKLRERLADWIDVADRPVAILAEPEIGETVETALGETANHLSITSNVAALAEKYKGGPAPLLLCASAQDEPALVERTNAALPGATVHGLGRDILFALSLGLKGPDVLSEALKQPLPHQKYAVLCTARSGSTYFCHLLQNTGRLGHPTEHLRPPVIFLLAHRHVFGRCLGDWLDGLLRIGSPGGVFGTKVIDEFVDGLLPHLTADDHAALERLTDETLFIHYVRRDRAAQAVSQFMADQTSVWHLRDEGRRARYAAKKAAIAYDGPAIKAAHDRFSANDARYQRFLTGRAKPSLTMVYEDVMADPNRAVDTVTRFILGNSARAPEAEHTRYFQMRDEQNAAFATRFRADYKLDEV
ncbi:MAG: Stf0 family sulfotransferase [Pseudomonadota bacterium]